jgi:transcriptional regulator with XRE-family HTH domain
MSYTACMTGDQLRKARTRLGLTQAALGDLIGTTGNTIARWERDEVPISEVAGRFIKHLVNEHGPPKRRPTRKGGQ